MATLIMTSTETQLVNTDQHTYNLVLSSGQKNKGAEWDVIPSLSHEKNNTFFDNMPNGKDGQEQTHSILKNMKIQEQTSPLSLAETSTSTVLSTDDSRDMAHKRITSDSTLESINSSSKVKGETKNDSNESFNVKTDVHKRSPRGIGDCLLQHEIEQNRLKCSPDSRKSPQSALNADLSGSKESGPFAVQHTGMPFTNTPPPSLLPRDALLTALPNTTPPKKAPTNLNGSAEDTTKPLGISRGASIESQNSYTSGHVIYSAIGSFDNSFNGAIPIPRFSNNAPKQKCKPKPNPPLQKLEESPPQKSSPPKQPTPLTKSKRRRKKPQPPQTFRPISDAYTPRMKNKPLSYLPATQRTPQTATQTMGTISRPNFRDALRRVAMIIQQHIAKIERRFENGATDPTGLFTPEMRDLFHESKFLTKRYECTMVRMPIARPGLMMAMKEIKYRSVIPTCDEIYEFAHRLFKRVQLSSECSIVCLIYVERLMEVAKVPLLGCTWKPIFMCGLLLASKVWQDLSSWNIELATVYPQFSLDKINQMELLFLKMVKWDLYISSSLYAKYYFALRSLLEKKDFRQRYNRMVGGVGSVSADMAMKIQKRTEMVKEEALLQLSRSM